MKTSCEDDDADDSGSDNLADLVVGVRALARIVAVPVVEVDVLPSSSVEVVLPVLEGFSGGGGEAGEKGEEEEEEERTTRKRKNLQLQLPNSNPQCDGSKKKKKKQKKKKKSSPSSTVRSPSSPSPSSSLLSSSSDEQEVEEEEDREEDYEEKEREVLFKGSDDDGSPCWWLRRRRRRRRDQHRSPPPHQSRGFKAMGGCSSALIISMCGLVLLDVSLAAHYTDTWAVKIEGGLQAAKALAEKHGFTFLGEIMPDFYNIQHRKVAKRSIYASTSHQVALAAEPQVIWIEQQVAKRRVKRSINFNDPKWSMMWYLNRGHGLDMNVRRAWERGYTGKGVVVTILDDGIEKDHPDLRKNYDGQASYDVNDHDPDPTPRYDYTNENRHGTRCAGEVAAERDNMICNVGVAFDASIGGVRMLDGDVTDSVEAQSLSHNPQHIHIYSASWGPDDDGRTVDGPATLARKAFFDGITKGRGGLGSIFVWASGNGGRDGDSCNCDGYTNSIYTLSISSATENGNIPWYSEACSSTLATTYSSGSSAEKQIVTTDLRRGCTETHTGTSASAPLAAGLCALALQANSMLTWRDMQHIVVLTAKPENLQARDWLTNGVGRKVSHSFGYGLMDASEMVSLARNWTTVPKQKVCEIRYPERSRVVPMNGKATAALYSTGCEGRNNHVKYLEHVQARVTLTSDRRGEIQIFLTSPMGTKSTLLARRTRDTSQDGFSNWAFMTTHNWGEFAKGTWMLEIENGASASELREWVLVIMGTREHPLHGNVTPENNRMDKNAQSFSSCAGISPTSRVCIECRVGFYKLGDKCVASCPVQYYGHVEIVVSRESRTNRTVASCHKCHTACFKCKGPRSIDCFECSSGYILKGRQCIPKQLLDFMGHSEFLIWAVLLAFLLLIILYTLYRLRHRCLCLQEKQQQNNPTIREMPLHSSAPSAPPPAWPSSRLPQQPTTTTTDTTTGTTTATTLDTTTTTTPSSAAATTPTTQPTSPQQVIQPSSQQPNVQNQQPLHHHHNTHNHHHRHHHHHHHHRPHNHHHPHYHRQQQQHKSNLVAAEQVF